MQAVLDEIIEKAISLKPEERRKMIQALQEAEYKTESNTGQNYVSPDTVWVRENSHKYQGLYIALKDGELIATEKTIKETDLKAKEKGIKNPLLHYIADKNEEIWGGW